MTASNDVTRIIKVPARKRDWLYARTQWETTKKSPLIIAAEIDVPPTELISRASREGWTRDLTTKSVTHAAELLLANKELLDAKRREDMVAIEKVNVAMQAEVLSVHRKDIKQALNVCTKLMERVLSADSEDQIPDTLETLQSRANVLFKLSSSMKNLILLQRQALGISTVLQDPENTDHEQTPQDAALDMLINKFASVLQTQSGHPASTTIQMGDVDDVTPSSHAHSPSSTEATA